jgi:hypothetical protein
VSERHPLRQRPLHQRGHLLFENAMPYKRAVRKRVLRILARK